MTYLYYLCLSNQKRVKVQVAEKKILDPVQKLLGQIYRKKQVDEIAFPKERNHSSRCIARLLDLNIIENCCEQVVGRVYSKGKEYSTVDDLQTAIIKFSDTIS